MQSFAKWSSMNEEIKRNLKNNHKHEILSIRMDILNIIKILRESENPYEIMKTSGWEETKEKHDVFGSYVDRLIGSLGETEDLEWDRFFDLIVLAKQRNMDMNLEKMSFDLSETYKKIKMING